MAEDTLQEQVWVDVKARNVELQPLERLDTLLNSIDTRISRINSGGNLLSRTTSQLASLIKGQKGVSGTSGEQGLGDVSKAFFPKDEQIRRNFEDFARRFQAEQKKAAKKYFRSTDTFASPDKAAAFTADVFQRQSVGSFPTSKTPAKVTPAVAVSGAVAVDAGQIKATLTGGQIPLIIDASQIVAQLRGQVALPVTGAAAGTVAAGAAGRGGGGGGRKGGVVPGSPGTPAEDAFSTKDIERSNGAAERRIKRLTGLNESVTKVERTLANGNEIIEEIVEKSPGRTALQSQKKIEKTIFDQLRSDIQNARREGRTGDIPKLQRDAARALRRSVVDPDSRASLGNQVSGEIERLRGNAADLLDQQAKSIEQAFRSKRITEALKRRVAAIDTRMKAELKAAGGETRELARIRDRAAAEIENLSKRVGNLRTERGLRAPDRGRLAADLSARAGNLLTEAEGLRTPSGTARLRSLQDQSRVLERINRISEDIERRRQKSRDALRSEQQAVYDVAEAEARRQQLLDDGFKRRQGRTRKNARGLQEQEIFEKEDGGKKLIQTITTQRDRQGRAVNATITETSQALKGLRSEATAAGQDFLRNTAKVTTWAASVGVLYGSLNLARAGLGSLIETGAQTARLDQVFSGIGGTTEELVNDTLALASANGRNADEALEASIQWSRLGLSYRDTLKAVEISLKAANIAELSAGDATKKLQAIYQGFGLTVRQLESFLGQINETTNTYNVTNAELLEGIARVGGVARQAGLELAELQGIIGATVGDTGQSGANIGNAIKSVIVALGNPAVQEFLGKEFNINVRTDGGADLKDFSGILSDLFVEYQRLTKAERQLLLFRVANKTQASRLASVLDSYVRAQVLAINGQLNLNSAEAENTKILATMKSRLQGVGAELARFVNVQGSAAGKHVFTPILEGIRNVIRLINAPVISQAVTSLIALFAVLSARVGLTFVRMAAAGKSAGFFADSIKKIAGVFLLFKDRVAGLTAAQLAATKGQKGLARGSALLGGVVDRAGQRVQVFGRRMTGLSARLSGVVNLMGVTIRSIGAGIAALGSVATGLGVGILAMYALNKAFDAVNFGADAAQKKVDAYAKKVEQARNAQEAAARAAKLYGSVLRSLENTSNRRDRKETLETAAEVAFPDEATLDQKPKTEALQKELVALDQVTDKTALRNRLEEIQLGLLRRRAAEQQREIEEYDNQIRELYRQVSDVQGSLRGRLNFDSAAQRVEDLNAQISELENKRLEVRVTTQGGEVLEDYISQNVRVQAMLDRQKQGLQNIRDIYAELASGDLEQRAGLDLSAAQAEQEAIRRMLDDTSELEKVRAAGNASRSDRADELKRQIAVLHGQQDAWERVLGSFSRIGSYQENLIKLTGDVRGASQEDRAAAELAASRERLDIERRVGETARKRHAAERELQVVQSENRTDGTSTTAELDVDARRTELKKRSAEIEKEIASLEEKARAARQRDVVRSETRIEKSVIKAQTFGRNETEQIAALFREADMESGRLQTSLRLINNEHTTAAQRLREVARVQSWLSEMSEAGIRLQERSNELELEKKRIIKEQAEAYSSALLQAGPSELLSRLAVSRFGNRFQDDPSKLLAFNTQTRRLFTEDPSSGVNPRLDEFRREERQNSALLDGLGDFKSLIDTRESELNRALQKFPLTLETATIRQEQLSEETAATAERIVALGAASGTATEALTNLADRVVEISETLGGVQQQIAGLRFNNGTNVAAGAPSIPAQEAYAA